MKVNRGFSHIVMIIVGGLLVLLAIGFFAVSRSFDAVRNTSPTQVLAPERPSVLPCGLTILDPQPNTKVHLPIIVRGYANGCGWNNAPLTLGKVKILNAEGQVISAEYPLTRKDDHFNLPAYFEATIPAVLGNLQTPMVIIFITSNDRVHPATYEIPVAL